LVGRSPGSASPLTNPARIEKLAKDAYIWGVAPEFIYRFSNYNELVTAPVNTFGGATEAAAWNNQATNAGNASVLYLNAMLDLSGKGRGGTEELVLTVPPSQSNYYVVVLLDAFVNDVGSIGTRTTPSRRAQTYLPVASIVKHVVGRFALNTLAEFEARGHRPKYYQPGQYTPTPEQIKRAAKWHTAPTNAVAFFKQVGQALSLNPLPTARTGLNGVPLSTLPSWVIPQANARILYRNPSYPQRTTLALFRPLGLTANGFTIPRNWGQAQINALQAG
jgi:hypothetical protein